MRLVVVLLTRLALIGECRRQRGGRRGCEGGTGVSGGSEESCVQRAAWGKSSVPNSETLEVTSDCCYKVLSSPRCVGQREGGRVDRVGRLQNLRSVESSARALNLSWSVCSLSGNAVDPFLSEVAPELAVASQARADDTTTPTSSIVTTAIPTNPRLSLPLLPKLIYRLLGSTRT